MTGAGKEETTPGKKPRERRIRFVPGQGSVLFAQARPFHATLKDTGDPRIKKLSLEDSTGEGDELLQIGLDGDILSQLKDAAVKNRRSASAEIEAILKDHFNGTPSLKENPLDRIFLNIMEATELTLDSATPDQQKEIIDVLRAAFRTLSELRHRGELVSPAAQDQLKKILDDLARLRAWTEKVGRGQ